mmetsp:Transcript_14098/g.38818  ORF Transcript_14098/g.38818 Transcript_14098/m.38818 type:complete len:209 (-) Transcript_14098:953-1579(-)
MQAAFSQPPDLIEHDEASDIAGKVAPVHTVLLQLLRDVEIGTVVNHDTAAQLLTEEDLDVGPDDGEEVGGTADMDGGHAHGNEALERAHDHDLLLRVELGELDILRRHDHDDAMLLRILVLEGRVDEVPQCSGAGFSRMRRRIQLGRVVHNDLASGIIDLVREDADCAVLEGGGVIPQCLIQCKWLERLLWSKELNPSFPVIDEASRS